MTAGASKVHKTITTLKKGTKVQILRDSFSVFYFRILYKDYTAYVPVGSLRVTQTDNPGWENARTAKIKYNNTKVKSAPNTNSRTLFPIAGNTKVIVLTKNNAWARILYEGKCGYLPLTALKYMN